jgi:hypothetical protein
MGTMRFFYTVLLFSFLASSPALSQTPTKTESPADGGVQIVFQGGSLEEYVAEVRKRVPTANVYVDKGTDVKLKQVNLPKVSLADALEFVTKTSDGRSQGLLLQVTRSGREANEVYVFTSSRPATPPGPPPEERLVKGYCLEGPKEGAPGKSPGAIEKGVQEALQKRSKQGETSATAKYNNETCLLTVVGTRADIVLADQVVDEMTRGDRATVPALRVLQSELEKLKTELATLKKKNEQ